MGCATVGVKQVFSDAIQLCLIQRGSETGFEMQYNWV